MNEIEMLFVEALNETHYGLPVVKIHGGKWDEVEVAVADDEAAADKAAREAAQGSLWAFSSSWIGQFLELNDSQTKAIEKMQGELCEDAQEIVALLIGDRLDEFLNNAIEVDGRGHFLSTYDGEEDEGENVSPALAGKLVYRIN